MSKTALCLLLALAGVSWGAQAQSVAGDVAAGASKSAACAGCHAVPEHRAGFPQLYRVPLLGGQSRVYLALALSAYRLGDRKNPTMRAAARDLSDQDIADLAAYYAQQRPMHDTASRPPATPALPGRTSPPGPVVLPVDLKDKLASCVACHGVDFVHGPDPANPRLAGQYADYLVMALKSYRYPGQPLLGRKHAVMNAMLRTLDDADLQRIAEFLGQLPGPLLTLPLSGTP